MEKSLEVLITGGNNRAGLAVARSLARKDISFLIVGDQQHSLSFCSRYVKNYLVSPSPVSQPEAFFSFILSTIQEYGVQLIIPIGDEILLILDRWRDEIEKFTRLAMPDSEGLRSVLDKRLNLTIAHQLGIPCPKQYVLQKNEPITDMIEELGLPIVLKPPGSRYDPELPSFPFKILYAHTEEQLRTYVEEFCPEGVYPIFQECATGFVHNICCFAAQGETLAIHEYQSMRRMRGLGILRKIVDVLPEAEQAARKILAALNWDGVAHIAFFVDPHSKKLFYMETNGRLWSSIEGSIHAGWDFPYWIYRYFLYGEQPTPGPIEIGSQTCWHRGDLAALMIYLLGGESPSTGQNTGKIKAIYQYLNGFNPKIHSDVFQLSDPIPALVDHWNLVKQATYTIFNYKKVGKANLFTSPTKHS